MHTLTIVVLLTKALDFVFEENSLSFFIGVVTDFFCFKGSFRVLTRILKRKLDNRRSVNHIPMSATQNFPLISMNEVKRMRTISRGIN